MEVHLALANKDPYGELLATALAFLELVFLLLDQTKPHLGHSNPMDHLSGHHIEFHAFEGLHGTQIMVAALAAFLASFLAKVPHKEHQIALEMEVPSLHCSSQILIPQSSHQNHPKWVYFAHIPHLPPFALQFGFDWVGA